MKTKVATNSSNEVPILVMYWYYGEKIPFILAARQDGDDQTANWKEQGGDADEHETTSSHRLVGCWWKYEYHF